MPFDGFEIEIEGTDGASVFPSLCAGGCRLWIKGRLRRWSRKRKPPTALVPGGHYGAVALLLTDARALIGERGHWVQGTYRGFRGQRCAVGALCAAARRIGDVRVLQSAHALLLRVADSRCFYTVESMNDQSTHADVVRAFDEAIAIAWAKAMVGDRPQRPAAAAA